MNARVLVMIVAAAGLVAGCPGADAPPASIPGGAASGVTPSPAAADPATDREAGGTPAAAEVQAHETSRFRLVVEATLTGVPEGAVVVAPSARDRRYQKVTRSEHSGLMGSVMPTEDGANLFFVSDPIEAGGGELKYAATFEVDRRSGTQGDVLSSRGVAYGDGAGKVEGASTDAAVIAAARALGEGLEPYDAMVRAVEKTRELELHDCEGSDLVGDALARKPATRYGLTALASELMRASGVPTRIVQGVHRREGEDTTKRTHAWLDVELPQMGWVPVDPVLRRTGGSDAGLYMGSIPADRVTLVMGAAAVIPAEEGVVPRLELSGQLVEPFAMKDGKRVGSVSWLARFESL